MRHRELGTWKLRELIAETAHSRVWRAAPDGGLEVAVKELKVRKPDKEPYKRFADEVALLQRLGDREGVLPLVDANVPAEPSSADPAWLAMPIAVTLVDALGEEASLENVVEALAVQARTLAGLHADGIFHRDLKPNNLFMLDGAPVVGDFGIATWPGKQALTEPGDKLGPAHFIAPEMVDAPAGADPGPTDVWSLAKTLWAVAVGAPFPPPGQLRPDQDATSLRRFVGHERAAQLEPILEQATRLDPEARPSMETVASELEAWLRPATDRTPTGDVRGLVERVRAITEPASRREDEREWQSKQMSDLYLRLRDGLHGLHHDLAQFGRVHVSDGSLLVLGLGGGSGRRDAIESMADSLSVSPHGSHNVSIHADVAYELFDDGAVYLVAGYHFPSGPGLREALWMNKKHVPLGTQLAEQGVDELINGLNENFHRAAEKFVELLEAAEAEAQRNKQAALETHSDNYVFRTEPNRAGHIEVIRKSDGSRDGFAVAWSGTPILELGAEGDRLYVRTETQEGWIARGPKENWSLAEARALDDKPDAED